MSTLALTVTRNMLGAAYLENDHVKILSSISYSEQNIESCNHDSLVLLQSQPVTVIVTSRADDSLLKLLENQEWVLEQRPSSDFRTSIGKQELLNLQLSDSFSLETFINANSSSIGCAGCIITYQSRSQIVKINQVSMVHLDSVMFIPKDTYWALSIFEKVQHPNIQSTSVVEGMSLYGILNKTKSKGGSKVLLKWFYNPLQRLSEIEYRQSMVELFALTENQESRTELQSQMKHTLLHRLHVSNTLGDWSHLLSFANSALKIINAIEQFNHDFFDPLKNPEWIQALETVRNDIARHIDFEESKKENRIVVNQHIDHDLDEIKRVYHGLNDFLGQLADRIVLPPNTATEFSLVYFPQLGFLIAIQFPPETQNYELAELSFQFSAEGSGYYKNKDMTDLDLEIGDIHSNICDRELEIIQRLRERVVEFQCLSSIASLLFELDVYLGLSEVAVCNRYVKPTMTDTDEFKLEMSRHPIMELVLDHFVPNTISFQQKAMAITGPNASGKSVLMQQVALITFMAHIGSFVPCSAAVIPLTDKILTKIRTPSTISINESSFYTDLRQACVAVSECTPSSLVLLDEFGKGTIPSDGIGLFCGIIRQIIQKQSRFILSTHFFEMFALNEMNLANLEFYTFRVYIDHDDIEFWYELESGKCTESLGILCATRAGMEEHVVERAFQVAQAINKSAPVPLLNPDYTKLEASKQLVDYFLKLDVGLDLETHLWSHTRKILKYFQ